MSAFLKLKRPVIFLHLCITMVLIAVSCNSKANDDEGEIAVTPAIVAVKEFRLARYDSVMKNLDSVFFSIDLNSGVIFNADSLPKGTNVKKLIAKITFANTMTKVDLTFRQQNGSDTTINYITNPEDSIDFSYPVTLDVTAQDGINNFSYQIKVNVHQQDPDSLVWDKLAYSSLPARFQNPVAQKTIIHDNVAYCLVEEYNGEYTLSSSDDLNRGEWNKNAFQCGFNPQVESFASSADAFFLLSDAGNLYKSSGLNEWENTGVNWVNILGGYGNSLLGIVETNESLCHDIYPRPQGFMPKPVEDNFPVYNTSPIGIIESEWADNPTAILAGGNMMDGSFSSNVWAFDGNLWAIINEGVLPAVAQPMLVRYIVYRDTPYVFLKREFDVWMLLGGFTSEEMNHEVYLSYDNGVNWSLAPESMQPDELSPSLAGADLIVADYELSANLSDAWTPSPSIRSRADYSIDGYDISWICPYLYVFGGYNTLDRNTLNTTIYRGVLQRLRFTPQI